MTLGTSFNSYSFKIHLQNLSPKGSMYPYSIYLGLKRGSYIGTLGSRYIQYGYMEPLGVHG